jgi:hypothetical protein
MDTALAILVLLGGFAGAAATLIWWKRLGHEGRRKPASVMALIFWLAWALSAFWLGIGWVIRLLG